MLPILKLNLALFRLYRDFYCIVKYSSQNLFLTGKLPKITRLKDVILPTRKNGSLTCIANGQQGIQSYWTSKSSAFKTFTSIAVPKTTLQSDFEATYESSLNIFPNVSQHLYAKGNDSTCQIVSADGYQSFASCSLAFTCSVFYVNNYFVSNSNTLTITRLNGKDFMSIIFI